MLRVQRGLCAGPCDSGVTHLKCPKAGRSRNTRGRRSQADPAVVGYLLPPSYLLLTTKTPGNGNSHRADCAQHRPQRGHTCAGAVFAGAGGGGRGRARGRPSPRPGVSSGTDAAARRRPRRRRLPLQPRWMKLVSETPYSERSSTPFCSQCHALGGSSTSRPGQRPHSC